MSHATFDATLTSASADSAATLLQAVRGLLNKIHERRANARDRKTLAGLSDAQLNDAGIDRAAIAANRPTIEVPAGLMANLMSMR